MMSTIVPEEKLNERKPLPDQKLLIPEALNCKSVGHTNQEYSIRTIDTMKFRFRNGRIKLTTRFTKTILKTIHRTNKIMVFSYVKGS